ncbi:MAG: hypothetical protein JNM14_08510 [Ferruginibacter sp.]|nr:hypothetical protein [Ferruginibacter sp.]
MKKLILFVTLAFITLAGYANKKNEGDRPVTINFKQSQFTMASQFLQASEIYWSLTKDGGANSSEIKSKSQAEFAENIKKDDKGNIISGTFRMMSVTSQEGDYPLYYKSGSNQRCYFIGNYFIKIKNSPIASAADVDAMVKPENVYELAALSKKELKAFDFEMVKSLLRDYYSANEQVIKDAASKNQNSGLPGNTWELKGFKMTGEGKKIAQYIGADDGKTRHNFVTIIDDTIVYTVIRLNDNGSVDAMKKWKMYIGVINHLHPYYRVWNFSSGSQKLYNVTIPAGPSASFICQEMLAVKDKPELVQFKKLEVIYTDEAEANAFLATVTEKRNNIKVTAASSPAATQGNDQSSSLKGHISFKNFDDNLKYKLEGGSGATRMSGSMCIPCSKMTVGKKVYLADNNGKIIRELFTVTEDLCGKLYDFKKGGF